MSFTHTDVQNIIQLLDASHFDELVLEMNGIKLELRRNGATSSSPSAPAPSTATTTRPPSPGKAPSAPPSAPAASSSATEDASALHEIRAPMLGTFYRAPKPGAAPFVSIGDRVNPETVIGIIEVMKLMNSTSAGVSGTIVEILVQDGELVEYDQPLMRVRT